MLKRRDEALDGVVGVSRCRLAGAHHHWRSYCESRKSE
jgi:hypothetical protein